jgi:D-arabinose 1-dehydrogenase-like Zn-dependent alcohol dehydrogenase
LREARDDDRRVKVASLARAAAVGAAASSAASSAAASAASSAAAAAAAAAAATAAAAASVSVKANERAAENTADAASALEGIRVTAARVAPIDASLDLVRPKGTSISMSLVHSSFFFIASSSN